MDFEWDEAKNLVNIAKHGFDFLRSRRIFGGRPRLDISSPRRDEVRVLTIAVLDGQSIALIALIWTHRAGDIVRIISMRRANRAEARQYREIFG
jgi:uncharacterized protein